MIFPVINIKALKNLFIREFKVVIYTINALKFTLIKMLNKKMLIQGLKSRFFIKKSNSTARI